MTQNDTAEEEQGWKESDLPAYGLVVGLAIIGYALGDLLGLGVAITGWALLLVVGKAWLDTYGQ